MELLKDKYPEYQRKSSNSKRDKPPSGKEYKQTIYKQPHIWKDASVKFSCSVMSDSFWPQGLQHTRLPCPSPTPGAYSNSCLSNQWCHPTISSSVIPFSCLQSFPASGSFPVSQFFTSVASWPAYRFLKRQVKWSGIPISWRIFHSLLWSRQSKALA